MPRPRSSTTAYRYHVSGQAVAGCSEHTAYHLSATEDFRAEVARHRAEAADAAGERNDAASQAIETLVELTGQEQPPGIRRNPAKAIPGTLPSFTEPVEVRQMFESIEGDSPLRVAP